MEETELERSRAAREIEGPDFTARAKDCLVVTVMLPWLRQLARPLPSWLPWPRRRRRLHLLPPTKRVHEAMVRVAELVDAAAAGEEHPGGLAECYGACALAMSRNRERLRVTEADLDRAGFGWDDVSDFLGWYLYFLGELTKGKN